jgi:hypothetical protein
VPSTAGTQCTAQTQLILNSVTAFVQTGDETSASAHGPMRIGRALRKIMRGRLSPFEE